MHVARVVGTDVLREEFVLFDRLRAARAAGMALAAKAFVPTLAVWRLSRP